MMPHSVNERLATLEEKADGFDGLHTEIKTTFKEVAKSVSDAAEKLAREAAAMRAESDKFKVFIVKEFADRDLARAKEKSFIAGVCFAYGTIGVIIGGSITAGFSYLLHKIG